LANENAIKEVEAVKTELDFQLRDEKYNQEILKNRLETVDTEMDVLKAINAKQKKCIQLMRQHVFRMKSNLEFYKGQKNVSHPPTQQQKPKKKKRDACASPAPSDNISMSALDMSGMMGSSLLGGFSPADFQMGYCPPFMVETENKEV